MPDLEDLEVLVSAGSMAECERAYLARHNRWLRSRRKPAPRPAARAFCVRDDRPVRPVTWSDAEDVVLLAHFGRWSRSHLRRALPGRPWPEVWEAACRLGIARRLIDGMVPVSAAARALGVSVKTLRVACASKGVKLVAYPPVASLSPGYYAAPDDYAEAYASSVAASPKAHERILDRSLERLLVEIR